MNIHFGARQLVLKHENNQPVSPEVKGMITSQLYRDGIETVRKGDEYTGDIVALTPSETREYQAKEEEVLSAMPTDVLNPSAYLKNQLSAHTQGLIENAEPLKVVIPKKSHRVEKYLNAATIEALKAEHAAAAYTAAAE